MTDNKPLTDEELWEKYSTKYGATNNNSWMTKHQFFQALSESRKGMFTEDDLRKAWQTAEEQAKGFYAGEDGIKLITFDQYLTERKGQPK